jgi:protein-disulfide isomerase
MKNIWLLVTSLVVTLIAVFAVAFLFTKKANAPVLPADSKVVLADARLAKGNKDAKITIVEFSDLQCPACKATQPLIAEIMTQASDSARLVFRHYPLRTLHPNAFVAAKASEAAANQGKFWEYHDLLYTNQLDWSEEKDPNSKFEGYAQQLGMNVDQFKKDYADKSLEARITKDEQDGNTLGVSGTPTFYVNNIKTDVNDLKDTVEKLLKQ